MDTTTTAGTALRDALRVGLISIGIGTGALVGLVGLLLAA